MPPICPNCDAAISQESISGLQQVNEDSMKAWISCACGAEWVIVGSVEAYMHWVDGQCLTFQVLLDQLDAEGLELSWELAEDAGQQAPREKVV